jgi:hypothetical protein
MSRDGAVHCGTVSTVIVNSVRIRPPQPIRDSQAGLQGPAFSLPPERGHKHVGLTFFFTPRRGVGPEVVPRFQSNPRNQFEIQRPDSRVRPFLCHLHVGLTFFFTPRRGWGRRLLRFKSNPPQPAIIFIPQGLAHNERALRFWILATQWSSIPLQPSERHIVRFLKDLSGLDNVPM